LNEIKWIPRPTKRIGRSKDKEHEMILKKAVEYTNEHYPRKQKNPIPLKRFIRTKEFITYVFPKKDYLYIAVNNERAYTKTYGISPRPIINEISSKNIDRCIR